MRVSVEEQVSATKHHRFGLDSKKQLTTVQRTEDGKLCARLALDEFT